MEVAGETLQRSRHISPAAGSYLQPYQGGMQVFFSKNQYNIQQILITRVATLTMPLLLLVISWVTSLSKDSCIICESSTMLLL